MGRLHATCSTLHTQAHRASTCKDIECSRLPSLHLFIKRQGLGDALLERIRADLASDPRGLREPLTLVPRRR